jgi:hypothetical protein
MATNPFTAHHDDEGDVLHHRPAVHSRRRRRAQPLAPAGARVFLALAGGHSLTGLVLPNPTSRVMDVVDDDGQVWTVSGSAISALTVLAMPVPRRGRVIVLSS